MQPTPDFDPIAAARKLLREGRSGALGTLMAGSGGPYCSLVNVATLADGSVVELAQPHRRGGASEPLTEAEFAAKFLANCVYGGWSAERAQAALEQAGALFTLGRTVRLDGL